MRRQETGHMQSAHSREGCDVAGAAHHRLVLSKRSTTELRYRKYHIMVRVVLTLEIYQINKETCVVVRLITNCIVIIV